MKVVRIERLTEFGRKHPDARRALAAWLAFAERAVWKTFQHVRQTYAHVSVATAGNRTVTIFNVRGNNYRLVTAINYQLGVVNVLRVMTHAEYDRDSWKETL